MTPKLRAFGLLQQAPKGAEKGPQKLAKAVLKPRIGLDMQKRLEALKRLYFDW